MLPTDPAVPHDERAFLWVSEAAHAAPPRVAACLPTPAGSPARPGQPRRIYHPVQRDVVTFVETAAETGGARTLVEVELAPGGGTPPHVHRTFAELFEALDGTLSLQLGRVVRRLAPGERATAPAGVLHRFFNETDAPIRFRVELRPGRVGAEHALRIAYGLACDGRVRPSGVPADLSHVAVLFALGESDLPGVFGIARPLLGWLARRARRRGVERELLARYCT